MNEGIIKFNVEKWINTPPIDKEIYQDIEKIRKKLYDLKFIGCYEENGLGYGNISQKIDEKSFVISGSQTGHLSDLNGENYSVVEKVDFEKNSIVCRGFCKPSSEAITHAAFYASNKNITSVIHIHNLKIWEKMIKDADVFSTPLEAEYGSVKLYQSIFELLREKSDFFPLVIVMKGHKEGVISAGQSVQTAFEELINRVKTYQN
ncbi:MAG TPA: class II aldolase/adducin family protein [Spirochaetota bacterium]|nr:class II aldolase/adducin family protein [Spirochaetota bacterium]